MRRQAGFTLLELLVGLVVLGFIVVGLSQGVRFGLRATAAQARLGEGRADLDAVDRAIRRLVEQADPGTNHSGPTLRGGAGGLTIASMLPAAAAGVTRHADVGLVVTGDRRLLLRWTPHLHAVRAGPPPVAQEVALLAGVDHLEVSYWAGSSWVSAWQKEGLPGLVRLRIVFPAGDVRHWPDLVVAPQRHRAAT